MKLEHKQNAPKEPNLIPLVNVVFLLLIFFIVAGALRPFHEKGIKPADSVSSQKDRPIGPVLIENSGDMSIGETAFSLEALRAHFRQHAKKYENKPLFIAADKRLAASKLVDVIKAANAAGIQKIRLVTRRKKEAAGGK